MKRKKIGRLKVTDKPEMRFEITYNGLATVLEGSELSRLNHAFFSAMHKKSMPKECDGRICLAVAQAYQKLYGGDVIDQQSLKNLSTADARKMDLFYRGACWIFDQARKRKP